MPKCGAEAPQRLWRVDSVLQVPWLYPYKLYTIDNQTPLKYGDRWKTEVNVCDTIRVHCPYPH